MEVREGMSKVVLIVGPGHSLREAAKLMSEKSVGAGVVIDEQYPGPRIISERDILNSLGRGEDPDSEQVGDHVSDTLIAAAPDWSLERAAMEMSKRHIRHLVVVDSGELSRATWGQAEEDIRAATTGKHGLLTRSVELDADALVVRATVLTYRWIDELQQAAYKTLGSIAGRAIGYLAPEVALGGAIVSAGLIETDAMDRDGVTAYLNELAENNPELMDHLSGGGGLPDGLHMRSLLTAGVLARPRARSSGVTLSACQLGAV